MSGERPLRIGIVAGEESGDLLGADLVAALARSTGRPVELVGVGGEHLASLGLKSLFDGSEIALMGISAILRDLPRLMRRIGQVARAIAAAEPDCLITIDSPAFSLRVAKKVRALAPSIPIVHYVCPSVWAWRSSRAAAMKPYVDHVLCLLPFEPEALARLHGPPGTFVGHRLLTEPGLERTAVAQATPRDLSPGREKQILVLPGSRRGEVRRLAGLYGDVIGMLKQRGHDLRVVLPTVPHVASMVDEATANWAVKPEIVVGPEAKWEAFSRGDAALATSGTVTLELALCGVPLVACYKMDWIAQQMINRVAITWSASLPNLIADTVIVPEMYPPFLRADVVVREFEPLLTDTDARAWQRNSFARLRSIMTAGRPSGEIAAEVVQRLLKARPA